MVSLKFSMCIPLYLLFVFFFGMYLCSIHDLIETNRYYMFHAYTTDIMERPEGIDPFKGT
jgi:hypothetical protein